ncbi:ankyrin-1-like [Planococcus citri]|uniref:ankyrin-1-like n=1 Tax=Planococcus citri TaxID=170843 RepID=UPI0031F87327
MQDPDLGDFNSYAKRAKEDVDNFNSEHKHHMTKNNRLIEAIKNRNESKVKALLKEGTSPNTGATNKTKVKGYSGTPCIRDEDGLSALHLAIKFGDKAIIELLLSKGAHPNIKGWKNGTTPIFNAVIDNRNDLVKVLLNHGANPSVINTKDFSPLYFSVTSNNEEMSKLLCEYNANPDISRQLPILFTVLNGIKNKTDDTTMTENILLKIKNVAEFLQSQNVPVDYSLFYESIDIAERNNERNIVKKIMKLLDELIHVSAPTS